MLRLSSMGRFSITQELYTLNARELVVNDFSKGQSFNTNRPYLLLQLLSGVPKLLLPISTVSKYLIPAISALYVL